METDNMKKCPYCAEMIKTEAIKCRYCGSLLTKKGLDFSPAAGNGYWRRVSEGKKIAGVCTGLARQFDSPILVLPLRVMFVVTTLFYGFGLVLYIALWLLMPAPTDQLAAAPQAAAVPVPSAPRGPRAPGVEHYPGQAPGTRTAPPPAVDYPGTASSGPQVTSPAADNGSAGKTDKLKLEIDDSGAGSGAEKEGKTE